MTESRHYVRIEPARERVDPADIVSRLAGLRELRTGWKVKYDPRKSAPTFEFLVLTQGNGAPVRFYLGVDDEDLLPTVESELQTAYPASYDISKETVELREELCGHGTDADSDQEIDSDRDSERGEDSEAEAHKVSLSERTPIAARWSGVGERSRDWMTPIKQYSQLQEEEATNAETPARAPLATAVERLADATTPTALQVLFTRYGNWQKSAEGRKKQIETNHDGALQSAKTSFVDMIYGADEERIRDRRRGRDPPHVGESTQQTTSAASGEVASRQALIDQKGPSQTLLVNLRTVAVLPDNPSDALTAQATNNIETLANAFNHLNGYFYRLDGSHVTKSMTNIRDPARQELRRLITRSFNHSSFGKRRPQLVLNADELANFVTVPSAQTLTTEGSRGARGKERLRQPLSLPTPDMLDQFAGPGMAVGKPLRNRNEPLDEPIQIPPQLLTTSYIRAASTGSGKSKATQNDMLSLDEHVDGPTVLLESKGDEMVANYLHAQYAKNGDLDDVYHFDAPETLPAVSFFDIRPALAMGRTRADAVQDKVEHFHEIMRLILGEERHENAYVANEILTFLIKALFDREYGQDAFSLEDLIQAVGRMSWDQTLPELCEANSHIERSLVQKCQVDDRQFQQTMGAAANRLDKLVEHDHLYQIFTHVPEWDSQAEEYVGNAFDFREFLDEDAVILFDIGELRAESRHALTMVLLSNLWDAVQGRRGRGESLNRDGGENEATTEETNTVVNMIIEEAAAVATSSLVYEQFIPQGRAFGVSLGLILQYPEQVAQYSTSDRPYTEILNNVKTKLIGNIATDAKLAESMAHENLSPTEFRNRVSRLPPGEWIVQLPSPRFGKTGPAPFSLASLSIPKGHPESDEPLSGDERHLFEEVQVPRVMRRTQEECSLPGRTDRLAREEAQNALEEVGNDADTETNEASGSTAAAEAADSGSPSSPSFFGAAGASDDTDVSTDGDAATAAGDTPADDSSSKEEDIESSPTFGSSAAGETQRPEEAVCSSSTDQTAMGAQNKRDSDPDTEDRSESKPVAVSQSGSTYPEDGMMDTEAATETSSDAVLSEHVSYDGDADRYICDVCGTEYTDAEERKASACCQFRSKDDIFDAARRARTTAQTPSELFTRLRRITKHAEDYGIAVTIQDFASLDASSVESPTTTDKDESKAHPETEQTQAHSEETSPRFSEATTDIPDETLHAEGVTRDEAAFLGLVLDAMNHQLEDYSLRESMTALEEPFANLDIETLKQKEFLEEHRSFRQKYYTVSPGGRTFLDRSLDASPGVGDLGEKTPHKAGVVFLTAWLAQQEDVARTEAYYQRAEGTIFDVAGFDAADELIWVGEVETPSNNPEALLADYEKLATVDATAVWACEDKSFILDVIETFTDAGKVDFSLTSTQRRTISSLRAAISEYDDLGMAALHTFRSLKTEVDTNP